MKLECFKTKWGHSGDFASFAMAAQREGYDGLEGPVSLDLAEQQTIKTVLEDTGFKLIAEICTGGSYVPDRTASVEQHISDFKSKLDAALIVDPLKVNCMAGCDAWPLQQSIDFFGQLVEISEASGAEVNFETHRSRTLFNPWITRDIALALPNIHFTCDFSHWCVVIERLLDTEHEAMEVVYERARHIHARVGYDQGPQVPHPAAPEYEYALKAHQNWWGKIWQIMKTKGVATTSLTPEFGPDGYLHHLPFTNVPIADLALVNKWMMDTERKHFAELFGPSN